MKPLKTFVIKVEPFAGSDIEGVAHEMCELANRIGCKIESKFNGVTVWARPGDNPINIVKSFHDALTSDKQFKYAQGD